MEKTSVETNLSLDLNIRPMHNNLTTTDTSKSEIERNFAGESEAYLNIDKYELDELMQEDQLNRLKLENKKLNDMLKILWRNYNNLIQKQCGDLLFNSRKRKSSDEIEISAANNIANYNHSTACDDEYWSRFDIKPNASKVHVRIDPSDNTLVVKDGYQWRKYGQKVTRDNPSPRAYYKCSYAPTCPVKKKVQRSANDPTLLVATYEGRHNHHRHSQPEIAVALPPGVLGANSSPGSSPVECPGSTGDLDLTDPLTYSRIQNAIASTENTEIQQLFVEQMASSLTRNHSFTAAIAAAITGRIFDDISEDNDDSLSNSRAVSL